MANFSYEACKNDYSHKWAHMEIRAGRLNLARRAADLIISHKDQYKSLQDQTNVPWYFIGLLHLRESNCNFGTHLHNGDPLSRRTVHVPAGRPLGGTAPFSFEFSAIDALKQKRYDEITDWSIERIAYCLEKYNGFGYRVRGVSSAYLWASSNQYTIGKFVRDGVFSASTVDTQLGAMVVLKCILDKISEQEQPAAASDVSVPSVPFPNTPSADVPRPTNTEMGATSRKWRITNWLQWIFGGTAAGSGAMRTIDASNITATRTFFDAIRDFVQSYGVELLIFGCIGAFAIVMLLRKYMKDDVQEGRATPSGIDPAAGTGGPTGDVT